MPSSRRPARLSIVGRRHERLPGLELTTTRPSFPPLSCIGCIGCDTPLAEAHVLLVYCWCHSRIRTDGMYVLLYFCLLLRRACSRCFVYIPSSLPPCQSTCTACRFAGAGRMDGRMDMYAPLATRGGGGRREMKMETEMPNTYLPTHLLAYPCTWSAFC